MQVETVIIGAGAAGLFCAAHAGPSVLLIDHAAKPAEKVRISGGGRCNFTNVHAEPRNFISENSHFCKSALARFTPWDFVACVDAAGISWHEKTLGQLFCDGSSQQIIAMLLDMTRADELWLSTSVESIDRHGAGFRLITTRGGVDCAQLVIACGGKSIPKMGATGFGYDVARQFGLQVVETRAGLVPLTFSGVVLERLKALAGISQPGRVTAEGPGFDEALLFTHRGLSGPAILQASNYWREGQEISVDLWPAHDIATHLKTARQVAGRRAPATVLAEVMPARLAEDRCTAAGLAGNLADLSDRTIDTFAETLHNWRLLPSGTEGYRTAEVTLGGVSTDCLSSKTMEARGVPGLFFIGECVDVTGWLGGYNFQWAWSSAHAAGREIALRR